LTSLQTDFARRKPEVVYVSGIQLGRVSTSQCASMMRCASVIISRIIAAASARVSVFASSIDKPLLAIVTAPDAVM
jgi:hypothetical protein